MSEIRFESNSKDIHSFSLYTENKKVGEMMVRISPELLTVYHTIVDSDQQGKGFGKQLLSYMAAYARQHGLKVMPLCKYVRAQFQSHIQLYGDIWFRATMPA